MKKKITNSFLVFCLFLTINCGFKVLDKSEINNFTIKEIATNGDERINFKIKNYLLINSVKNTENILVIDLKTEKTKSIKEKNIKNEITKYQISIAVNIKFRSVKINKIDKINLVVSGTYLTADNYSQSLNNEKILIDNLVKNISSKIIDEISFKINDI